ncbi:agmatinase family protein [Thalassorhabdus alkalitolerans]|uniref:Agmatinase family protein n=1 Tax=Thalassorhabdus alkalitolerans TaxID=2282697 RepID=A0ABW0YSL6_9BACI
MSQETIYGNTPCFLNSENLVNNRDKMSEKDIVFYGVPWEGAVTWGDYTGCELAPKVIRLCSARYSCYLPELNHMDMAEHLTMGDLGDVDVVPAQVDETMERIQSFSGEIWKSGAFPIAFGGDHGITYPIIESLTKETEGKVGIIHLDAHYDNNLRSGGDLYGRGSPFARLYETEGVRNESLVHLGIHGPRNKPENGKLAKEAGASTFTIKDIREADSLQNFSKKIYDIASEGTDKVYLSICSDVLDYAFNPGGPADGNGLTPYELVTMIHEFASMGLCGMDYVEVYPQQDTNDFSSHFVSTAVLYALAGVVKNRQSDQAEA